MVQVLEYGLCRQNSGNGHGMGFIGYCADYLDYDNYMQVQKISTLESCQAISIDTHKGVWVSAIVSDRNSFKTLLGNGLLPKRYIDSNLLTGYKETNVLKICGMERLFATHVQKIHKMKRTMDRL